jgi:23S rRNA (guanosine2251-2'-O)-methyltransferase
MRKLTTDELSIARTAGSRRNPISVLVDNVRSLYNVGSIFRTCDAAGVTKLYLTGFTPYPPRKELEKTALGAIESVPWEYHHDALPLIAQLKSEGFKVVAVEQTEGARNYDSIGASELPVCLVVGHEITGVSSEVLNACDFAVQIPMYGVKHSLNVAVACGIAVYGAVGGMKKSE